MKDRALEIEYRQIEGPQMYQFFTAKVGKLIDAQETKDAAFLQLDIGGEQDAKPNVVSALVQAVPTDGQSQGVLLPFKEGVTAHLVLDIAFVRRLQPGNVLRVEWETRSGGIMNDVTALARQQ
jgi:tRNA-binding EMAP/Myf-like protein